MKYGYKKVTQRLRWLRWLLALSIPLLLLFLVFGKGGIIHNYVLTMKLNKIDEALVEIERSNYRLQIDIRNASQGNELAKIAIARQAFIAPKGSVIYIFPSGEQTTSIGESLDTIEKESVKGLYFGSFLGSLWSD